MPQTSTKQRARKAETTREKLLDAGLDEFADRGYTATRLADVVGAAGLTTGAFYRHFESKAQFVQVLFDAYSDGLQDALGESKGLAEKAEAWMIVARRYRGVVRSLLEVSRDEEAVAAQRQRLRDTCAGILALDLQPALTGREARRAALVLVDVLAHYALSEAAGWIPPRPPAQVGTEFRHLVERGLYK